MGRGRAIVARKLVTNYQYVHRRYRLDSGSMDGTITSLEKLLVSISLPSHT
jgi:hypothetical protein